MALYVLLEPVEQSPEQARLKAQFGAMRMAAELATGHYAGFDDANRLFGVERANSLRNACAKGQCQYRGRQFMIQRSGLFDMMSKHGKAFVERGATPAYCPPSNVFSKEARSSSAFSLSSTGEDNPECVGCRGSMCWGCTGVWTEDCRGHDECVDEYGHLACLYDAPMGSSLIEAIGSFLGAIAEAIADLFNGFDFGDGSGSLDACETYVVCKPWDDLEQESGPN